MAKRTRSQMEDVRGQSSDTTTQTADNTDNETEHGEDSDNASDEIMSTSQIHRISGDQNLAIKNVIRMVMSRNLKGQLIRREHITQAVGNSRVGYDLLLRNVSEVLARVYGLTLQQVPNFNRDPEKRQKGSQSKNKAKQAYCVVSCLPTATKEVLGEIWSENIDDWPTTRKLHENQYFLSKHVKKEPFNNIELVKSGILLLIMSVLVISENHLTESELVKTIKRYGISDNLNIRNSNLNVNLFELLGEFRKKDYIEREIIKGSTESENVTEYYLGKRAKVEFPPESMFEYLKTLFVDSFDKQIAKKFIVTIERAYGVKLDINDFYNEPNTSSNTDSNTDSNTGSGTGSGTGTRQASPYQE